MKPAVVTRRTETTLQFLLYNTACSVVLLEHMGEPGAALDAALAAAQRVQCLLDAYDDDSALASVNRAAARGCEAPLAIELYGLLKTLLLACDASGGSFDITIGRLCRLWSFTSAEPSVPDEAALDAAFRCTGWRHVWLDGSKRIARFARPGMQLDIGAAGKGFAADAIGCALAGNGAVRAAVNLGGNLLMLGDGPVPGRPWRVGVQRPWQRRGQVTGTIVCGAGAVSTSGGYDRYFVQNGRIYHHLLNPHTGRPADGDTLCCTVVCPSALAADILSTVLFIGGVAAYQATAKALGVSKACGYIIQRGNDTIETGGAGMIFLTSGAEAGVREEMTKTYMLKEERKLRWNTK